ncbi:MAG TPA: MaoC family dehydratase N-terminal domain-containing protein [Jiangellaceae bacterium]
MTVDPTLAGRVYPPQPYDVGREKIREFAEAIGDANPAYRDPDAARALGHEDIVAPPTFAMIPVLRGFDVLVEDLGIDYSQVIHADQRFEHNRPIRAGDRLSTTTTLESVRSRAGNDFLGVRCEVTAADGGPVCTAKATLLVRPEAAGDA